MFLLAGPVPLTGSRSPFFYDSRRISDFGFLDGRTGDPACARRNGEKTTGHPREANRRERSRAVGKRRRIAKVVYYSAFSDGSEATLTNARDCRPSKRSYAKIVKRILLVLS